MGYAELSPGAHSRDPVALSILRALFTFILRTGLRVVICFIRVLLRRRGPDMKRRDFIKMLGGFLIGPFGAAAAAAQQDKLWRIGVLETSALGLNVNNMEAFRAGLRELGYIEGRNLVIDYRSVDGFAEGFPKLASELIALKSDLIL